jgi:hypothetical protein
MKTKGFVLFLSFLAIMMLLTLPQKTFAYPNGVAGTTLKTSTAGCSCHSSTPSSGVAVFINGFDTVNAGQSYSYTVTVTGGTGTTGGVDIAAFRGSLNPVSSFLKLSGGELVHNAKASVPSTYNFTYTAPSSAGTDTLYATGKGASFSAWNWAVNKRLVVKSLTGVLNENEFPTIFNLKQNYPNPFNPSTSIQYAIPRSAYVSLKVYDVSGKEVANLVDGFQSAGEHNIKLDGSNLPSGVYLYRLIAGNFSQTKKLAVMK